MDFCVFILSLAEYKDHCLRKCCWTYVCTYVWILIYHNSSLSLYIYLSIHPSIHPFIHLSIYLTVLSSLCDKHHFFLSITREASGEAAQEFLARRLEQTLGADGGCRGTAEHGRWDAHRTSQKMDGFRWQKWGWVLHSFTIKLRYLDLYMFVFTTCYITYYLVEVATHRIVSCTICLITSQAVSRMI